jgi:hypothetical protein
VVLLLLVGSCGLLSDAINMNDYRRNMQKLDQLRETTGPFLTRPFGGKSSGEVGSSGGRTGTAGQPSQQQVPFQRKYEPYFVDKISGEPVARSKLAGTALPASAQSRSVDLKPEPDADERSLRQSLREAAKKLTGLYPPRDSETMDQFGVAAPDRESTSADRPSSLSETEQQRQLLRQATLAAVLESEGPALSNGKPAINDRDRLIQTMYDRVMNDPKAKDQLQQDADRYRKVLGRPPVKPWVPPKMRAKLAASVQSSPTPVSDSSTPAQVVTTENRETSSSPAESRASTGEIPSQKPGEQTMSEGVCVPDLPPVAPRLTNVQRFAFTFNQSRLDSLLQSMSVSYPVSMLDRDPQVLAMGLATILVVRFVLPSTTALAWIRVGAYLMWILLLPAWFVSSKEVGQGEGSWSEIKRCASGDGRVILFEHIG